MPHSLNIIQNRQIPSGSTICCCSYLYTYWTRGIWIYPLYYHLSWTQQILMNVVTTFIVPGVCYLLGEAIASALWGETLSCHARVVSNGNNVVN